MKSSKAFEDFIRDLPSNKVFIRFRVGLWCAYTRIDVLASGPTTLLATCNTPKCAHAKLIFDAASLIERYSREKIIADLGNKLN